MSYLARALVAPIRLYQRLISPFLGARCRYEPSCSEYTARAILRHGPIRGIYLGIRRLLRCHPWSSGGFDDVPQVFSWRPSAQTRQAA
ncbi:MAG TPA: membrane protein insertion efficiency factor YidD [Actinomycetota bacterium]|jgi:putative membrane protein insertion efficiency factor|nr:membrane protein insertion efficiency factor YidD [Actinomycetota bacterium]